MSNLFKHNQLSADIAVAMVMYGLYLIEIEFREYKLEIKTITYFGNVKF